MRPALPPRSTVVFWHEFASTYSYPAAMRIEAAAAQYGVHVRWKPFLLGPIFKAQGWTTSPFNLHAAKGRYMWRDLERICAELGLAFRRPSAFPRNGLLAARVATAAADEDWLPQFAKLVYIAQFEHDLDIASPQVIAGVLDSLDLDATHWLERAQTAETKGALRARNDEAAALGIFGAPTLQVADELFWGNDRIDMAMRHAASAQRD